MPLPLNPDPRLGEEEDAPLSGTRAESMQRLQVGLFGLGAMVMIIGLADIVISRVQESEASTVAEPAPAAAPSAAAPASRDPLAEAGILPEIPAGPVPEPTPSPSAQPLTGDPITADRNEEQNF